LASGGKWAGAGRKPAFPENGLEEYCSGAWHDGLQARLIERRINQAPKKLITERAKILDEITQSRRNTKAAKRLFDPTAAETMYGTQEEHH
jgi:hypothetical protein